MPAAPSVHRRLPRRTAEGPNRSVARSTARSASGHPGSGSPMASCRPPDLATRPESLDPDAHQAHRQPQREDGVEQEHGRLVDVVGDVGRLRQRPRPGDGAEVAPPDRDARPCGRPCPLREAAPPPGPTAGAARARAGRGRGCRPRACAAHPCCPRGPPRRTRTSRPHRATARCGPHPRPARGDGRPGGRRPSAAARRPAPGRRRRR